MKASTLASRSEYLVCPICQAGELHSFGGECARCSWCECIVGAATLLTLEQIIALPDALGRHACECGHPEMRLLCLMGRCTAPPAARKCFPSRLSPALRNDQCGPGGLARLPEAYGTFPFRATSSPEVGRSSTCSSVMSKVWQFRASGATLSNTLVSPSPTLVNEPALMRFSPETNHNS